MGNEGPTHNIHPYLSPSRSTPSRKLERSTLPPNRRKHTFTPPTLLSTYNNLQHPTPLPKTHTALSNLKLIPDRETSPPATSPPLPPFPTAMHKPNLLGPSFANTLAHLSRARGTRGSGSMCLGGEGPAYYTQQHMSSSLGAPFRGLGQFTGPSLANTPAHCPWGSGAGSRMPRKYGKPHHTTTPF